MLGPPSQHICTRIPALLIPSDGAGNWTIELGTESVQSIWSLEMRLLEVGGASNQSCGWSDGRTHPTLIIPTTGEARTSLLICQGAFANISSRQHLAMGILSVAQQLELEGPMHTSGPFPEQRHSTLRCRRPNLQHNAQRCFGSRRMQTPMERISPIQHPPANESAAYDVLERDLLAGRARSSAE